MRMEHAWFVLLFLSMLCFFEKVNLPSDWHNGAQQSNQSGSLIMGEYKGNDGDDDTIEESLTINLFLILTALQRF